jgi:NADH:ubiquinone oxidoreductase subunit K
MILLSALLAALSLATVIMRKSILGTLVGIQLGIYGAVLLFVFGRGQAEKGSDAMLFAFFILLSGVVQWAVGFALAVRLFYFRRRVDLDEVRSLRG